MRYDKVTSWDNPSDVFWSIIGEAQSTDNAGWASETVSIAKKLPQSLSAAAQFYDLAI